MRGITDVKRRLSVPGSSVRQAGRGGHAMSFAVSQVASESVDISASQRFALKAGPYQNNGATQWYAEIPIGAAGQTMKMALDTGGNFIWMTSTLCGSHGCRHYGEGQFNPAASNSFRWVNQAQQSVSFGPWGTMTVELGQDYVGMPDSTSSLVNNPYTPFYLSVAYSGDQFVQLDWDGGLGLPSGSAYADPNTPPMFATLLDMGLIDPAMPYMSFVSDRDTGQGLAWLGGYDTSAFDAASGIFMRWSPYTAFEGVEYIWTTSLAQMRVGDQLVASNVLFALDSGSSQFKGDDQIMKTTLELVSGAARPDVRFVLGNHADGSVGELVVPPEVYEVTIQAGPQAGQTLPQFNPLGLTDLVLVGSALMDHLYTIYEYTVTVVDGKHVLSPAGMWLFNKVGGPRLIRTRSTCDAILGKRT